VLRLETYALATTFETFLQAPTVSTELRYAPLPAATLHWTDDHAIHVVEEHALPPILAFGVQETDPKENPWRKELFLHKVFEKGAF